MNRWDIITLETMQNTQMYWNTNVNTYC